MESTQEARDALDYLLGLPPNKQEQVDNVIVQLKKASGLSLVECLVAVYKVLTQTEK